MTSRIPATELPDEPYSKRRTRTEVKAPYDPKQKIYVRAIQGYFQKIRKVSLFFLFFAYFSFNWITINGNPLIHFNISEQKFSLFGTVFWPQDFILLALALVISAFGLFFITSLFGRIWCGYSCPQTTWTFLFMWLEEKIEGSRIQRMKLDKAPNSVNKTLKKSAKHISWLLLAFATGFTFVSYFYPAREFASDLINFSVASGDALFWLGFFTLATYLNAGWLREQVCLHMCPYARFQSVMFNSDTMIIGYDKNRGEPRGNQSKTATKESGSCIDCNICVQVCPTGIDIRDGLQYECIGCALCIDACDEVMEKIAQPKGLIRYASEKEFEGNETTSSLNFRAIAYALVLLISVGGMLFTLKTRPLVELDVRRDRGALYQVRGLGEIRNNYVLQVVNKREFDDEFTLTLSGINGRLIAPKSVKVSAGDVTPITVSVEVNPDYQGSSSQEIFFEVQSQNDRNRTALAVSRFLSPVR